MKYLDFMTKRNWQLTEQNQLDKISILKCHKKELCYMEQKRNQTSSIYKVSKVLKYQSLLWTD